MLYDFLESDEHINVNLGEESITRRIWDYDQNDFHRYRFRWLSPISEEDFLKKRGEQFGKSLYEAFEEFLDGDKEVMLHGGGEMESGGFNPGTASRSALEILNGDEYEPSFYLGALEAVEDEMSDQQLEKYETGEFEI